MIRYLFFSLIVVNLYSNPYQELDFETKFNLFVNYFLNEELKATLPKPPVKKRLEDDGASLEPIKHELYFNYIQRLKAIKESREAQQKKIDEKYEGQISFYRGKLRSLKKFYKEQNNLKPFLQKALNKAFKVVYGKPYFKNISYDSKKHKLYGFLSVKDIYHLEEFKDKEISFYLPKNIVKDFLNSYSEIKPKVQYFYNENNTTIQLKNILFEYNYFTYEAYFINDVTKPIKLKIKINDDIFSSFKINTKESDQ